MRIWTGLGCTMLAATALAWPGALRAQEGWQDDLAAEIVMAQKCKVAFLSHVVERTVDGKKLVMAKAHCDDQRVFDAMRPDEFEPFQFNECQPATAQSC